VNVSSSVHRLVDLPSNVQTSTLNISFTLASESKQVQVQIKTPDENQNWIVSAKGDAQGIYHLPPLSLGAGIGLPEGSYTMDILYKDGQTLTNTIPVTVSREAVSDAVSYVAETRMLSVRSPLAIVEAYDENMQEIPLSGENGYEIPENAERVLIGFPEEGLFFRLEP